MKLPASDKVASFGKKPLIKKGYYPAQLLEVKPYADSEGNLKESTYGRQLIFSFAIFKPDPETGAPICPLKFKDEHGNETEVVIPKFAYHEYKAKDKATGKWIDGEYQTAITPNSAITKTLKALGWEFNPEGVETDALIGKWVEVNINDYEQEGKDSEKYTASGIVGVDAYEGPEITISSSLLGKTSEPKSVQKQIKHSDAPLTIEDKKRRLKEMLDSGTLTQKGYDDAMEQLDGERC